MVMDRGGHSTRLCVERWDEEQTKWVQRKSGLLEPKAEWFRALRVRPYSITVDTNCNLILDTGWAMIMNGIAGTAVTKFSATVGRVGIGSGSTAATYGDTALGSVAGLTGSNWILVSATPIVGATHGSGLTFAATFSGSAAVGSWQEFGTDQGTASAGPTVTPTAVFFNHGVSNQGSKPSGQTFAVTETITWS